MSRPDAPSRPVAKDTAAPVVPKPPVPWRGRDLAAMAGLGLLGVAAVGIVGVAIGWDFGFDSPAGAIVLLLNGTLPALLAYGYLVARFAPEHRYVWRPGGSRATRWAPALGVGLALGVAWWVVGDWLALGLGLQAIGLDPPPAQEELTEALGAPGWVEVAAWVAIVVVAPVSEELVFRGIVFLGLARWIGPVPAALVSSAVFGLIHLQPSLAATVFISLYAVSFGLLACWLVHRYGTLWLAIGAHAGSNLATVAIFTALESA